MPPRAAMVSPQAKNCDERAAASERCAGTVGRRERPAEHDPEPNSHRNCYRTLSRRRASSPPYNKKS